jgi:hypothetical protein
MKGRRFGIASICLGLALVAFAAVQDFGQTNEGFRTVRGYLCRNDDSPRESGGRYTYGYIGLIVGKKAVFFRLLLFGPAKEFYNYQPAQPKTDRLGSEYMVKYIIVRGEKQANAIAATGRFKSVKPCVMR